MKQPEPDKVTEKLILQWIDKADQDVRAAELLLNADPPFLYPACFHAQQAVEKYLKALLTHEQIEFPKTHAIERLLDLIDPILPDIASALSEAVDLTPYGVEVRYPGDQPEPDAEEADRAVSLALVVRDTILPLIQEREIEEKDQ